MSKNLPPIDENVLVDSYQRLILREARLLAGERFEEGEFNSLAKPDYCLRKHTIKEVFSELGEEWERVFNYLKENGLLIELGDGCYRTLHMDLLVRASDTRTHPGARQGVILSKFAIMEQAASTRAEKNVLPSKDCDLCKELRNAIHDFIADEKGMEVALEAIKDHFKERNSGGYDPYQAVAIVKALKGLKAGRKSFVITAPTGAGKTEVFLTVTFLTILKNKVMKRGGRAILTYPRKMLEIDQMERIIAFTKSLNKHLLKKGLGKITIAIRDGDTRGIEERVRSRGTSEFRGIRCGRDGKLYAVRKGYGIEIVCREEDAVEPYDFIVAETRRMPDADIIVTNFSTLAFRLASAGTGDLGVRDLVGTDIIVIDEAHEYDSIELQNIKYTLGIISMLSELAKKEPPSVILSSATLPNYVDFARELIGNDPVDLSLEKLASQKLMGRRLILYLLVMLSPFVSWQTYISELAAILTYLHWRYRKEGKGFVPQAIAFINNVKEVNRAKSILDNALSLGSPLDNLCTGLRRRSSECDKPPHKVPRIFKPYYALASEEIRKEIERIVAEYGNLYGPLSSLYEVVFSGVPLEKRAQIYEMIKKKELAFVYATTSLELGVDYPGVSFIINAGFDKAARLVQRIGRGGRSADSMMAVLGIIVAKNNPIDYRKLNDSEFMKSLLMPGTLTGTKESASTIAKLRMLQANAVLRAALAKALYDGLVLPELGLRGNEEAWLRQAKEFLNKLAEVLKDGGIRSPIIRHLRVEPEVIDELVTDIESFEVEPFLRWYRLAVSLDDYMNSLMENAGDTQKILQRLSTLLNKTLEQLKDIRESSNETLRKQAKDTTEIIREMRKLIKELKDSLDKTVSKLYSSLDECVSPQTECSNAGEIIEAVNETINRIFRSRRVEDGTHKWNYFNAINMYGRDLAQKLIDISEIMRISGEIDDIVKELENKVNEFGKLLEAISEAERKLRNTLNEIRNGLANFLHRG